MSRLDFGDGWSGPEPEGPAGRALFMRATQAIPHGISAAVEARRVPDAGYLLLARPIGEGLIRDTLRGWDTAHGPFTAEWFAEAPPPVVMEAAQVVIAVWMAAGFFGQSGADQIRAEIRKALGRKTPASSSPKTSDGE